MKSKPTVMVLIFDTIEQAKQAIRPLVHYNLTQVKPPPPLERREDSSESGDSSPTYDPARKRFRPTPSVMTKFVDAFALRSLSKVVVNYRTRENCHASVYLFSRDQKKGAEVFFSKGDDYSQMRKLDDHLQALCNVCIIKYKVITMWDDVELGVYDDKVLK